MFHIIMNCQDLPVQRKQKKNTTSSETVFFAQHNWLNNNQVTKQKQSTHE